MKTPPSKVPFDGFDELGITVCYNENLTIEAFEFSLPAEPIFIDKNLLEIKYDELLEWFSELDPELEEDDTGFTSLKLGIGVYAPFKDEEPNEPPESVIIFKKVIMMNSRPWFQVFPQCH